MRSEAVEHLQGEGVADAAPAGASAGADAILGLLSQDPRLAHQLILPAPTTTIDGLGDEPKHFVASKDEPVAHVSSELAESSPGETARVGKEAPSAALVTKSRPHPPPPNGPTGVDAAPR